MKYAPHSTWVNPTFNGLPLPVPYHAEEYQPSPKKLPPPLMGYSFPLENAIFWSPPNRAIPPPPPPPPFKAYVLCFLSIFHFQPNESPSKTMKKCSLFHLESSFCSQDVQIFVFPSSSLFLPASHCFRGWSNIHFKVYDMITCLNKNLIKHFVWYLGKGKRYDRVLNKNIFMEKSHRKCALKASHRPLFNFGK